MIEQLKELVGRRFSYKENEILIKNVKKVSGVYVVLTDNKTYNFFEKEVPFFLKDISELPKVKLKQGVLEKRQMELQNTPKQQNIVSENVQFDVKSVLIETIEKIRSDRDYIPQANAICNVVTQMINIQKLEIQIKKQKP
jgi:hypothetical protein